MPVEVEIEPEPPPADGEAAARRGEEAPSRAGPALLACLVLAIPSLAALVFGAPLTAGFLALPALVVLPGRRVIPGAIAGALAAAVLLWVTGSPIEEYRKRTAELVGKQRTEGPAGFTTRDLAAIWEMNVLMALGGFACGLPEVASETLLLAWPWNPPTVRFDDDFAMRSPKVRAAIAEMMKEAKASGRERIELGPTVVSWSRYDVSDSPRVALALNRLTLRANGRKIGREWSLDVSGTVPVRYPQQGTLEIGPVTVHEGLFWVAQERGWLRPYEADWRWSVNESDPRLAETAPVVSWVERKIFPVP